MKEENLKLESGIAQQHQELDKLFNKNQTRLKTMELNTMNIWKGFLLKNQAEKLKSFFYLLKWKKNSGFQWFYIHDCNQGSENWWKKSVFGKCFSRSIVEKKLWNLNKCWNWWLENLLKYHANVLENNSSCKICFIW